MVFGLVLQYQGKYKEAEAIIQRPLDSRENILGPDHPDTLACVMARQKISARQPLTQSVLF
ncbi:hypothetical protein BJX63DRAFT_415152 [Aspergillus granulosus]|uniref:Kinesin light chain n=1 Tax=Aspergillus granulosus TaxID=176169 RepID=A0ABR4GU10_9EURO